MKRQWSWVIVIQADVGEEQTGCVGTVNLGNEMAMKSTNWSRLCDYLKRILLKGRVSSTEETNVIVSRNIRRRYWDWRDCVLTIEGRAT